MRSESNRLKSRMVPAMVAWRKWLAVNHSDFMWLSMVRIVLNPVNARTLADLSGPEYIANLGVEVEPRCQFWFGAEPLTPAGPNRELPPKFSRI